MDNLQKDLNLVLKNYSNRQTFKTSILYVFRTIVYTIFVLLGRLIIKPYLHKYLLYLVYSICMGTVMMGYWVLGHECGHGAFGKTTLQNDVCGFILHSALLVPYFSWKDSHNKHHKYTNHLEYDEAFVPPIEPTIIKFKNIYNYVGPTVFGIFRMFFIGIFGWVSYLFFNFGGGDIQSDIKTPIDETQRSDHFFSSSQIMKNSWKVEMSTIGCLSTIFLLWHFLGIQSFYWYGGPYVVMSMWVVLYTWLHHTDTYSKYYSTEEHTFLKGALTTIDRNYPKILNHLHFHLGSTHVIHHLRSSIPHYYSKQCTKDLVPILGEYYQFDPSPIWKALVRVSTECLFVNCKRGIQTYKKW